MITPGLLRRALLRACQWRPILLQLILLAIAGQIAAHPWLGQFGELFSQTPQQKELTAHLGSFGLTETLLRLVGPGSMHAESGLFAAILVTVLANVVFAGAILAAAASDELLHSRELLEGAGRYYGRLFRMLFAGLVPLGVCGAIAAGAFHWSSKVSERAITEAQGNRALHVALGVAVVCYVLAGVWTDLSRALFVAQPARRSALFAMFAGTWLLLRRPLRALAIGAVFDALSLLFAAVLMIARQQLTQTGWRVLLALVFAQGALALLAWGRIARLLGLVELARADVLARKKPAGTFEMAPPKTSPPPPDPAPPNPLAAEAAPLLDTSMIGTPIIGTPTMDTSTMDRSTMDRSTMDTSTMDTSIVDTSINAAPPPSGGGTGEGA